MSCLPFAANSGQYSATGAELVGQRLAHRVEPRIAVAVHDVVHDDHAHTRKGTPVRYF
jgi:hypothetical protein